MYLVQPAFSCGCLRRHIHHQLVYYAGEKRVRTSSEYINVFSVTVRQERCDICFLEHKDSTTVHTVLGVLKNVTLSRLRCDTDTAETRCFIRTTASGPPPSSAKRSTTVVWYMFRMVSWYLFFRMLHGKNSDEITPHILL